MPYYYILRVVREDNPLNKAECQIKFFPIMGYNPWLTRPKPQDAAPIQIEADDEPAAWLLAKARFPFHACSLALQEVISYDRTVAGLVSKRLFRGNANLRAGAKAKGPIGRCEPSGDSGIPENRGEGLDANEKAAELAF